MILKLQNWCDIPMLSIQGAVFISKILITPSGYAATLGSGKARRLKLKKVSNVVYGQFAYYLIISPWPFLSQSDCCLALSRPVSSRTKDLPPVTLGMTGLAWIV
jgi:hypothetical protein